MPTWIASARAASRGIELVSQYRKHGHLWANLDPLKRCVGPLARHEKWWDEEEIAVDSASNASKLKSGRRRSKSKCSRIFIRKGLVHHTAHGPWWTQEELLSFLSKAYCDTISIEAAHLESADQRLWWYRAAEKPRSDWALAPHKQRELFLKLLHATLMTNFLREKFPSTKWFAISGCDALLPGLFRLCSRSAQLGVEHIEMGMPHRGRLAVIHGLYGKSMSEICAEMHENQSDFHVGDVKYHLGYSGMLTATTALEQSKYDAIDPEWETTRKVMLNMMPNPSHLEVVGPVVAGKVRAMQDSVGGGRKGHKKIMGVVIHGDAAFSMSGVSFEMMQLARLPGYSIGGTVHVVLNNQIGYTTEPAHARSSAHPSDMAKAVDVPVIHVNADDVEAVDRAFTLAAEWRSEFARDVIIDFVGYRRYGHNESDNPEIIHPKSYTKVKQHKDVITIFGAQLVEQGVLSEDLIANMQNDLRAGLEADYQMRGQHRHDGIHWLENVFSGRSSMLTNRGMLRKMQKTGVPLATLRRILSAACTPPQGFTLHPDMERLLQKRLRMLSPNGRVDFPTAEMLAFASILLHRDIWAGDEGVGSWRVAPHETLPHRNVRLSGQDSRRGTFNQRHFYASDAALRGRWEVLTSVAPGHQARFSCFDSPLSELGVLGFEYGYSIGDPESLVCWEAQFGDFANCAQVIIDQFIASGEEKWGQSSAITLLLPHGYDGQGPDHSSARLERFLQLVNDDPDTLPGASPAELREIEQAFDILDTTKDGRLSTEEVIRYISDGLLETGEFDSAVDAWSEIASNHLKDKEINRAEWRNIMQRFYRRNAEQQSNIFVVNVSTPAQYFHLLRRQAHRPFKKPLVIMTPKYLLHHAKATSAWEDFGPQAFFRRVILDHRKGPGESSLGDNTRHLAASVPVEDVRRLILCSGQVYYALSNFRQARKIKNVVILRLEQLAPFPYDLVAKAVFTFPHADVVWCQEEPKNMGAWFFVQPRLAVALHNKVDVEYVGRAVSAATATGSHHIHREEMRRVLDTAFAVS